MMEELLSRRLAKINHKDELIIPDIVIIDGGRGQYNSVLKILNKFNLNQIKLLSVSKGPKRNAGREIIHLENKNINLKPNDSLLHFIQRLRDEAHRFAITAHRARRSKSSVLSVFDEIKGIGPRRKKELLLHFGTIEKIKSSSLEELKKIKSIPEKKLEDIFEFFNG